MPPTESRPKVVFLSHAAERTGPPILLYRLLSWLGDERPFDAELVFLEGGDLLEQFAELAPVHVLNEFEPPHWTTVVGSFLAHLGLERSAKSLRRRSLRARLAGVGRHDLVFVNTAGSVRALRYLPDCPRKVITEIHELSVGLEYHLPAEDRALILAVTDHFITVADAVTEAVVGDLGIRRSKITRRYGFVDRSTRPDADEVTAARKKLGLPIGARIIGASGLTHWRKGPDLFLLAAQHIRDHFDEDVRFIWVGGSPDDPSFWPYRYDLEDAGLGGVVQFVPHQEDPLPIFALFDVFVLTSREDAFPLVGIEAAALGCPVVCFETGGLPELVRDDAGIHVPFPDITALGDAVISLLEDERRREALGVCAAARVEAHHLVSVQGPGIISDIERVLGA